MSSELPSAPPVGATIQHQGLGIGEVLNVEAHGLGPVVTVQFALHGTKDLMWAFVHPKTTVVKGPTHVRV